MREWIEYIFKVNWNWKFYSATQRTRFFNSKFKTSLSHLECFFKLKCKYFYSKNLWLKWEKCLLQRIPSGAERRSIFNLLIWYRHWRHRWTHRLWSLSSVLRQTRRWVFLIFFRIFFIRNEMKHFQREKWEKISGNFTSLLFFQVTNDVYVECKQAKVS